MSASSPTSSGKPPLPLPLLIILIGVVLGIGARFVSLSYAPQYSYEPDHKDFLAWSEEAWRNGPTGIYARHEAWPVNYRLYRNGQTLDVPMLIPHACNYLPLSTWIFWAQGGLWSMLADEVTLTGIGRGSGVPPGTEVTGHLANTWTARFVGALPGMLFDFALAWGVAALVVALGGGRVRAAFAFAITLLAPPIFLDSSFWNQADAWVAAPLVWTLVLCHRQKFVLAGLIYGCALLLKPQAILFGPVLLFIAFARFRTDGLPAAVRPILTGVIALVVAFVLALPHSFAGAKIDDLPEEDAGWQSLLWFKRGYVDTVGGDLYKRTTLNAFNLWWFDYQAGLAGELAELGVPRDNPQFGRAYGIARNKAWDSTATMLGLSKDTLGKVLLAIGLIGGALLAGRKWRWRPPAWLAFTFVLLLCAFMLPTRVHERYIFLCIPFAIALAMLRPIWWAVLGPLLIVGTFEMTSFRWANNSDHAGFATMLALLATLALLISFVILAIREKPESP